MTDSTVNSVVGGSQPVLSVDAVLQARRRLVRADRMVNHLFRPRTNAKASNSQVQKNPDGKTSRTRVCSKCNAVCGYSSVSWLCVCVWLCCMDIE